MNLELDAFRKFICRVCHEPKPGACFQIFSNGIKQGRRRICRDCRNLQTLSQPSHSPENIQERNKKHSRGSYLKSRYGITEKEYDVLLQKQEGKCAICRKPASAFHSKRNLGVDHNHITGENRGLLCTYCNVMIGKFEKNIGLLESFIEYMRQWSIGDVNQ